MPGDGLVAGGTRCGSSWPGVSGGGGLDHEPHPQGPASAVLAPRRRRPPDFFSRRDNGNTALDTVGDDDENGWASFRDTSLDAYEALELLTLGEVVSQKAHDSQLSGIRAAPRAGAS